MPTMTSAATHYELTDETGTLQIPLMLVRPEPSGSNDPAFPTIQQALAAAEAGQPASDALESSVQMSWAGGIGAEEDGYTVAIGINTRTPNAALAAGAVTQVQGVAVTGGGPIVAWAEFAGALYYAQYGDGSLGGRVCKSSDGTGVGAGAFANATGFPLALGRYVADLFVHDDGAGVMYLYAAASDVNGLNGVLYRTSDGIAWTNSGAVYGTNGRGRTRTVNWLAGGISAERVVTISAPNKYSFTLPDADPFGASAVSWVEGAKLLTPYSLIDIVAAKTHAWFSTRDNLLDVSEDGDTIKLLADAAFMAHGANGLAVYYQDGWVYQTAGDGGLHRVWVGAGPVLQEQAGTCGPGYNTRARSDWLGGYATAICGVQGYICVALYNPLTRRTGIFFGIDREKVGAKTRNPLAWYGPEYVTNDGGYKVTRMWTSTLAGDRRLWIAAQSTTGLQAVVLWASLPDVGAPIDTLMSDGLHRYNSEEASGLFQPFARLEMLPDEGRDINNGKVINDVTVTSEELDGTPTGTRFTVYLRADPAPRSTAWGTGTDVTTSPTETFVPATEVSGRSIQTRIDFVNPDGEATPPQTGILRSVRRSYWEHVRQVDTAILTFEYGDGVTLVNGGRWSRLGVHPDTVTAQLEALMTRGRTTIRDPYDNRKTAKLHQILDRVETITERGDSKKHVRVRIKMSILEDAA